MRRLSITAMCLVAAQAGASETRQLDAHEHGVTELNIAIEGSVVAMEMHAPGADIVGFEYSPTSDKDRAAVTEALARLERPLELFVLPAAAGCSVTSASAVLELEEAQDVDDHGEKEAHAHDKDHGHKHDDHAHDKADHHGAGHAEFHVRYLLNCDQPGAISQIDFVFFEVFDNAREVEVQVVTGMGAQAFEVERETPVLDLRNLLPS